MRGNDWHVVGDASASCYRSHMKRKGLRKSVRRWTVVELGEIRGGNETTVESAVVSRIPTIHPAAVAVPEIKITTSSS